MAARLPAVREEFRSNFFRPDTTHTGLHIALSRPVHRIRITKSFEMICGCRLVDVLDARTVMLSIWCTSETFGDQGECSAIVRVQRRSRCAK